VADGPAEILADETIMLTMDWIAVEPAHSILNSRYFLLDIEDFQVNYIQVELH
jgi:hypothetical protein